MKTEQIDRQVSSALGAHTASKGKAYWQKNRVQLISIREDDDETLITAHVKGSRAYPYTTLLALDSEEPGVMEANCNCPVGLDCKHGAAVAYKYLSTRTDSPGSKIDDWLTRLRNQRAQTRQTLSDDQDRVIYLLEFAPNKQLAVTPVKVRRLKKGGYGQQRKVDLYQLKSGYVGMTALDAEIGQLLSGMSTPQYGYYPHAAQSLPLKGEAGAVALKQMLLSGRLHLKDKDGPLLSPGPVRALTLSWRKNKTGWRLQTDCDPPLERWFMLAGPWYYDSLQECIGPLETEIESETLTELLKIPSIPAERLEEVTRALLEALPEVNLPIPAGVALELTEIKDIAPRPQLSLRGLQAPDGSAVYAAELEFDYDGVYLSPVQPTATVRIEQDDQIYQLYRQLKAENAWRDQLAATGLLPQADGKTSLLPGLTPRQRAEAWAQWLSESLPQLEEQDWNLHVASDFGLGIYSGEQDWQAEVTESEQANWFDLSLGIEIEGRQLNLLPILVSALQREETPAALLARLDQQDHLLLSLGGEQWLKLPSQRMRGIVATLIELYDSDALGSDGSLSLSWYQALGLESLLNAEGLVWQGAERLKALTDKLRQFGGLAPVALPEDFGAQLRPYQLEGYHWLQFLRDFGFHGILADDMGLGKTVQTLAHLLMEQQSGRADRPSLVIAPTSVISNWQREAARFAPQLKVKALHGLERKDELTAMQDYDLLITTYTLIRLDLEVYLEQEFHLLILDEAQYIKNPQAKTALAVCQLKARHRLALSGTPMENHLGELWSIYHFLMPGFLGSLQRFSRLFRTPIEKQGDQDRAEVLRQRVKPFLLRRSKTQVEQDLPAKTEIVHYVSLSGAQRDLYETLRVAMDARVKAEIEKKGLKRSQIMLLDALLKLRQACCDPRLLKLDEARKVKESAKLEFLTDKIPEMVEEGRRILIFSQFVAMLDLIESALNKLGIPQLRLTGATRKRDEVIDQFQRGEAPVFLISLKAGGVGLNLTAADTVIHYDPWWNPAAENQATDRAWRIGQDKPVFVYKLITEQTIEEKILALQAKKRQLSDGVYTEQEEGALRIEAEELLSLLEA